MYFKTVTFKLLEANMEKWGFSVLSPWWYNTYVIYLKPAYYNIHVQQGNMDFVPEQPHVWLCFHDIINACDNIVIIWRKNPAGSCGVYILFTSADLLFSNTYMYHHYVMCTPKTSWPVLCRITPMMCVEINTFSPIANAGLQYS